MSGSAPERVTPETPASEDAADAPVSATTATRGLGRKLLAATLLGVLVFAGLSLYSDVQALRSHLSSYRWETFALALALAAANYGVRFWRWEFYLHALQIRVPRRHSLLVFIAGFSMSVTPGKVGEVFKSLLLYDAHGIPRARSAPIVVAERLTDLLALVLLCALGSLSFDHGVSVAVTGGSIVLGLVAICAYRPAGLAAIGLLARLPVLGRAAPKLEEAYGALQAVTRPRPLAIATLVATISWGLECVALYGIVHGFPGTTIGWDAAAFAYAASTIAGALAMMPGGLGVTEVGMTGLLQLLSQPEMSAAAATATTLLVRLATLWFAVVLGVIALWIWRWSQRQAQAPAGAG